MIKFRSAKIDLYTVKRALVPDHLSTKTTLFVCLENGLSLNHVLKEPVYKDHLPIKTTFLVFLGWSL